MVKNDNPISMLAIEENQNNFFPIDISELDLGSNFLYCSLKELDCLVFGFGVDYIREQIKNANIFSEQSQNKEIVIIYDDEGKIEKVPLITRELLNDKGISELVGENVHDKVFLNRIYNRLDSMAKAEEILLEQKNEMITALKSGDINVFITIYDNLPYIVQRKLLVFIARLLADTTRTDIMKRVRKDVEV